MTTTHAHTSENEREASRRATSMMRQRQRPLVRLYRQEPAAARIFDGACTVSGTNQQHDPVHGELSIGTSQPLRAPLSIHSAVGGDHDGPNPGDYLSAALVGCFNSTFRIVADRFGVELEELSVACKAEVDVRGTLCVSPDVPVAFQRMQLSVTARAATSPEMMQMLLATAEHCCVVYQTLRPGVRIDVDFDAVTSDANRAGGEP